MGEGPSAGPAQGADPNWPPFSSLNRNGTLEGIDTDITQLVAQRVGLKLTLVHGATWTEVYEKAKAGEVDFLSATARSPERLKSIRFHTDNYGEFPIVVVTRTTSPFFTTTLDLSSMTLAEPQDHITTGQLQKELSSREVHLN